MVDYFRFIGMVDCFISGNHERGSRFFQSHSAGFGVFGGMRVFSGVIIELQVIVRPIILIRQIRQQLFDAVIHYVIFPQIYLSFISYFDIKLQQRKMICYLIFLCAMKLCSYCIEKKQLCEKPLLHSPLFLLTILERLCDI